MKVQCKWSFCAHCPRLHHLFRAGGKDGAEASKRAALSSQRCSASPSSCRSWIDETDASAPRSHGALTQVRVNLGTQQNQVLDFSPLDSKASIIFAALLQDAYIKCKCWHR